MERLATQCDAWSTGAMTVLADALPDDPGTLKAMLIAERVQNERLRQIIKELQRHRFGRRAETLPEDQMLLGLEEVEQVAASGEAQTPAADAAERASRSAKRRMDLRWLPRHLPRVEIVVDTKTMLLPAAGRLDRIGEDTGERLDMVPAQFRVLVVRRPKYGCRACENVVVQAPAPGRLIEVCAHRSDGRPDARIKIRRSLATLSAMFSPQGLNIVSLVLGRLGRPRRLYPGPVHGGCS